MSRSALIIERGDTLTRVIDWDDPAGAAIDLTGYAITCTITVGAVILNLTEGSGLTVDDLLGRITLVLTRAQTTSLVTSYGHWKLYALSAGGVGTTLTEGYVFVSS